MEIELQYQPSPVTCGQTCLAMICGMSANEVVGILGDKPINNKECLHFLIKHNVYAWQIFDFMDSYAFPFFGCYLATVPSLNNPGELHKIVIQYSDRGLIVYDPASENVNRYGHRDLELRKIAIVDLYFIDYDFFGQLKEP